MTPENSNGWDKFGERVLSDLADLKSGQERNRASHQHTRETVAVLTETVSNLARVVEKVNGECPKHAQSIADLNAAKADRADVKALRNQTSVVGVIGGAIGIILLWLRGKM